MNDVIGRALGPYRIVEQIGAGWMGESIGRTMSVSIGTWGYLRSPDPNILDRIRP